MKALARLPAAAGMAAMQSINVVVLNGWFLGVFSGTALLSLLLAGYALTSWNTPAAPWLIGGAAAYVAGTWLLTIVGNVPLNKRLQAVLPEDAKSAELWSHYLKRWTSLNSLRALGSIIAALLFMIAMMQGMEGNP